MTIFCDMDGVLADFDTHHENVLGMRPDKQLDNVDWDRVRAVPDFYSGIPPMPDMQDLWSFIAPLKPIVLTGIPKSDGPKGIPEAADNKRAWITHQLGPQVEVRCVRSKEKSLHCFPGDILIDDWERYRHLWEKRHGIWITHISAGSTIACLKAMGVGA